jgi:uncharacterized protein
MFVAVAWSTALAFAAMLAAPLAGRAEERQPMPSFACAQATQWVEKAICSDPELAALDRRLSRVFAEAERELPSHARGLLAAQRDWLRGREECRAEEEAPAQVECLSAQYRERIKGLVVELPVLAGLRRPVSGARANQAMAIFHLLTPDDLYDVTTYGNRDALAEVSCRFFELYPEEAAELFGANDYSSRDAWRPLCPTLDIVTQVPATGRLLSALETISGNAEDPRCLGTMQHGIRRNQSVARIMAVVDRAPEVDAGERGDAGAAGGSNRHPGLARWGMQGLWEKRRYADLREGIARARPALAADYARRFHLDAAGAGRLADDHIERLIAAYVGPMSTPGSYSLCLTTGDLDGYLASGKVPEKECPDTELADPAPQATLRRLLGLAIVNDYPTQVVKRLIAAGARLDPPDLEAGTRANESRESLLMLAAARADVIDALLAAGADPNRRNAFGKTALMYAVQERNLPGVRRLLQAGADVDAATTVGESCLVVQPGGRTALMYAAWQATPAIVQALLDDHADPGRADSQGKRAADYVDANRRLSREQRLAVKATLHASGDALLTPTPAVDLSGDH